MVSQGKKQEIIWKNKKTKKKNKSKPVSTEVPRGRWNLLGQILGLDKETPARKAMKFMFEERWNEAFRGRKRAAIHTIINPDIKKIKEKNASFGIVEIKSEIDLLNVGIKPSNKNHWKFVVKQVVQAAYFNTSIRQQQWNAVHNVHWRRREQAEVVVVYFKQHQKES